MTGQIGEYYQGCLIGPWVMGLKNKKAPTRKEVKNVEAGIVNVLFINKIITTESSISMLHIGKKSP